MIEELKPCPFCGGEARMSSGTHAIGRKTYRTAKCTCRECGVTRSAVLDVCASLDEAESNAADAWNRRAERTCRNLLSGQYDGETFKCSECGYACEVAIPEEPEHYSWLADWHFELPAYCPNCGAKVVER